MDTTFIDELTLNDGLFECLEFAECGVPVSPTPNLPRCDSGVPDETPEKAPKRKKLAADGESTAKPKPKPKPAATPEAPLPDQPTIPEYFRCKRAPSTMQPLFSEPPAHTEAADGDLFCYESSAWMESVEAEWVDRAKARIVCIVISGLKKKAVLPQAVFDLKTISLSQALALRGAA